MADEVEVQQLRQEIEDLKIKLANVDTKVEAYKNGMTQVVNLAFGLIASATLAIIISNVK